MTLVFEKQENRPGTHALIIGVGGYSHLETSTVGPAPETARFLADWLIKTYNNPNCPLASVEMLVSAPRDATMNYEGLALERPTLEAARFAVRSWFERAASHPANITFFYFIGRGEMWNDDASLLFEDARAPDRVGPWASFRSLVSAMQASGSQRQVYVVEAASTGLAVGDGVKLLATGSELELADRSPAFERLFGNPEGTRLAVFLNAVTSGLDFAYSLTASAFARAFIRCLDQLAATEGLGDTARLAEKIIETEPRAWQLPMEFLVPSLHSIPFHYAPPSSDWKSEPLSLAPDREPGSAPPGPGPSSPKPKKKRKPRASPSPPPPPVSPPSGDREGATDFVPDDAETERDDLGRSVLAIGLARRLHRIWRGANETGPAGIGDDRAAFVVHLDAPWGGGKTTFANYLARVLDPVPAGREPAAFLRDRYGEADLGGIFLDDPPADGAAAERLAALPAAARRPWIVVPFNAWQVEHCAPPWWVFYQTIRKGCFDAVLEEGDLPWSPQSGRPRLPFLQRLDSWLKLWLREIGWRVTNPKVRALLITAAIGFAALFILWYFGIWGASQSKDGPKAGFSLASAFGLFLTGLTGVTALWGVAAVATESIIPGTDTLAERLSLGSGDPFERFRRHFARTIARVRRPVMVVVDDLDRCKPDFVVGIVRGMQTLLRSPRVVFVILGDRDWIERAFEAHHKVMEKVDVGPEQTFGARFVEKAIQMSFILPAMGDDSRLAYVRRVLLGQSSEPGRTAAAGMDAVAAKAVREVVNREAAAPDSDPFDTERIVTQALKEVGARPDASIADEAALQLQVKQLVGETLAINATSSDRVEQAVAHQLEALAAHFPANPRQIKRIVNAITVYYAVALQRPGLDPDEAFRTQLALWIIVMTEWPETWRLLAAFPALVGILQSEDPIAALQADGADLPGSLEATTAVVKRILADAELMALIRGRDSAPLDPERVPLLAQLTPLHSRKRRLPEGKAATAGGDG
jgi:hypothetical protein